MQPRLDKKPVVRLPPLTEEAFIHATLPMDVKLQEELKKLYGGAEPDHALQEGLRGTISHNQEFTQDEIKKLEPFNKQFKVLINHLRETCKLAGVAYEDKPLELKGATRDLLNYFSGNFTSRKEYQGQSAEFYSLIKQSLESIAIPLRQLIEAKNDKSVLAKAQLEELISILLNCAPGITKHTHEIKLALYSKDSINLWLARLRKKICEEFISNHIKQYDIYEGGQPHAYTTFLEYAHEIGINPLGGEEFKKVKETYGNQAQIYEANKKLFLNHFINKYTPSAIMHNLAESLHNAVNERLQAPRDPDLEYCDFIATLADIPLMKDNSCIVFDTESKTESSHTFKEVKKDKTTNKPVLVNKPVRLRSLPEIMIQITNYYVNRFAAKKGNPLFDTVMGDVEKDLIRDDKGEITESKYSYYLTPGSFDVSYIVENETAQITSFRTAASQGIFPSTDKECELIRSHNFPVCSNIYFNHLVKKNNITDFSNQTLLDINLSEYKIDTLKFNNAILKNVTVTPDQFIALFNRGVNIEGCYIDIEEMDDEEILEKNSRDKGILLIHAIHTNNPALVTLLTQAEEAKKCADLTIKYKDKTALAWATSKWQVECIEGILNNTAPEMLARNVHDIQHCFEMYITEKNNYQSKGSAKIHKNHELIKLFLKCGARPNGRHAQSKKLLPHIANMGDLELLKLFVESGCSIDQEDSLGQTALMWAAYRGHKDIVQYLLDNNANLDAQTTDGGQYHGWKAIQWAGFHNHKEIVDMIKDNTDQRTIRNLITRELARLNQEIYSYPERKEALARLKDYATLAYEKQDLKTLKEIEYAFFKFARRLDNIDDYAKKVATLNEEEAKHQGRDTCIRVLKEHVIQSYREFLTVPGRKDEKEREKKEVTSALRKKMVDLLEKEKPQTILDNFVEHDKSALVFLDYYENKKISMMLDPNRADFFNLIDKNLYDPEFMTPKKLEDIIKFDSEVKHGTWYDGINTTENPIVNEAFGWVIGYIHLSYAKLHKHLKEKSENIEALLEEESDKIKQMQQKFIEFTRHRNFLSLYDRLKALSTEDLIKQLESRIKSFLSTPSKAGAKTTSLSFKDIFERTIQNYLEKNLDDKNNFQAKGTTYIHKNPQLIKVLLTYGGSHGGQGQYTVGNYKPLHIAADKGDLELLKMLLEHGFPINQKDELNMTALMWAAYHGHKDMVQFLLDDKNADLDVKAKYQARDALGWAIFKGHREIVAMIEYRKAIIDGTTRKLETIDNDIGKESRYERKNALVRLKLYGKLVLETKDSAIAKAQYDKFTEAMDKLSRIDTYAAKIFSIDPRETKHVNRDTCIAALKQYADQSYQNFLNIHENKDDKEADHAHPFAHTLTKKYGLALEKIENPTAIVEKFIAYDKSASSFLSYYNKSRNISSDADRLRFLDLTEKYLYDQDKLTQKNIENILYSVSTISDRAWINSVHTNWLMQEAFAFVNDQISLSYRKLKEHLEKKEHFFEKDINDIDRMLAEETQKIQEMKRKFNVIFASNDYLTFSHILNEMIAKQRNLAARGYKISADVALNLIHQLTSEVKTFLNTPGHNSFDAFRDNCLAHIQASRKTLERNRDWKCLLGNLTLAILCVGVACAATVLAGVGLMYIAIAGLSTAALFTAAASINYACTGNVGFFRKTRTIELLEQDHKIISPLFFTAPRTNHIPINTNLTSLKDYEFCQKALDAYFKGVETSNFEQFETYAQIALERSIAKQDRYPYDVVIACMPEKKREEYRARLDARINLHPSGW